VPLVRRRRLPGERRHRLAPRHDAHHRRRAAGRLIGRTIRGCSGRRRGGPGRRFRPRGRGRSDRRGRRATQARRRHRGVRSDGAPGYSVIRELVQRRTRPAQISLVYVASTAPAARPARPPSDERPEWAGAWPGRRTDSIRTASASSRSRDCRSGTSAYAVRRADGSACRAGGRALEEPRGQHGDRRPRPRGRTDPHAALAPRRAVGLRTARGEPCCRYL
jgi:hypothetical protein